MHLKMAIIDEQMIVLGSYNYTEDSAYENIEQLLTLSNEELAKDGRLFFLTYGRKMSWWSGLSKSMLENERIVFVNYTEDDISFLELFI